MALVGNYILYKIYSENLYDIMKCYGVIAM